MTNEPEDDVGLDPDEREALAALSRGPEPPATLQRRVVAALRREGLLRPRVSLLAGWGWVAAALACLALGLVVGRAGRPAAEPEGNRFVLLLERGLSDEPPGPERRRALAEEYRAWARATGGAARVFAGERLGDTAVTLSGPKGLASSGAAQVGGYFLVAAADLGHALELARSCPHLRYGGRVVVQPIESLP